MRLNVNHWMKDKSPSAAIPRRPTRKEIDYYYKTHRSQFQAPERIHVANIVKNVDETADRETARQSMEEAAKLLADGREFMEVARLYSDCGDACDLGWFVRGFMVEEFDDVAFELSLGATSPVFETRFGFHIVRLLERRAAGIQSLGEVHDWIGDKLFAQRRGTEELA